MAKRQAYTRRRSGETTSHGKRKRCCLEINASEMRAACDAALRRANVPINMTEEMHLKHAVKEMAAEERKSEAQHNFMDGTVWPEESTESE